MSGSGQLAERVRFHLRFGWWTLLLFACLGLTLEVLHGLKVGYYLDVANETRRLMWRLAHAHGALLSVLHVAFAATLHIAAPTRPAAIYGSRSLVLASLLMPAGFFLGGLGIHGGDPGLGIGLVPVGAVALLTALALTGVSLRKEA